MNSVKAILEYLITLSVKPPTETINPFNIL